MGGGHETLEFTICYQAGWIGWALAWVIWLPLAVTIGTNSVAYFYGRDIALYLTTAVLSSVVWVGTWGLGWLIAKERPDDVSDCINSYALPDATFVTGLFVLLSLSFVAIADRTKLSVGTAVWFIGFSALYLAAVIFNGYLTWGDMLLNLALVLVLSAIGGNLYLYLLHPLGHALSQYRLARWLGFNESLTRV